MAESAIILDTGPLVAFMVAEDRYHEWAVERFKELPAPFVTCEPVLTEAFHLLARLRGGTRRFFDLLACELVTVDFDVLAEREALDRLTTKYGDQPMSLADACLVRMVERRSNAAIFTIDGHFRVYRQHGRRAIPTIMPPR